ncbi:MAG: DUF2330 domain-containing protein [Flavobacteriales bacterium]|nr:DUF2330 domain-containing protein [Flavobacteriales bacterium]
MKKKVIAATLAMLLLSNDILAFCGFYVAKASTDLFNEKSEVILVRNGDHTVITMSNDFQGDVKDFAMVVPVPVVLSEGQIKVVERGIFDRLDAYSAPRLVEYHDANPCTPVYHLHKKPIAVNDFAMIEEVDPSMGIEDEANYGVTIEAEYTIGEYDILLLSAMESEGLEAWLTQNGYKIPPKAAKILQPYILSDTKFFVVKVNLDNQQNSGFDYLRPLQISFESDRFMLPLRLGMANANGPQDLVVYGFSKQGRIEPVNYRTVKVPTGNHVPQFINKYFGEFYKDLFHRQYHKQSRSAVFLEYAWNVSPMQGVKCDPCVSPPPVFADFKTAGVNWVTGMNDESQVFFTRLHVRYEQDKFPQDLKFHITPNTDHFQARYVITHPAKGDLTCSAGQEYIRKLESLRSMEVSELSALAGWKNPNYLDYITEYSQRSQSDKFAPNKNNFFPSIVVSRESKKMKEHIEKWAFLVFVLAAVIYFRPRRRVQLE